MKSKHRNKREKLSALFFDLVKYLLTVIGVGAVLPESTISIGTALAGVMVALLLLTVALVITPEDTE